MNVYEKLEVLKENLNKLKSLAVAFSGGVDSTFLLKVAKEVLGNNALAVTVCSSVFPKREYKGAKEFVDSIGIRHAVDDFDVFSIKEFRENSKDRCYYCKRELFLKILEIAKNENIGHVADGSNIDDLDDFRPGMRAIRELNVISPLKDAMMTKEDIRHLSREMGLRTWTKPSLACLASRVPYDQEITEEKLKMVNNAEQYLIDLGFRQVRVRHHGDVARIEVAAAERAIFFNEGIMDQVGLKFREIGFKYAALDLMGYRTGSMNEVL